MEATIWGTKPSETLIPVASDNIYYVGLGSPAILVTAVSAPSPNDKTAVDTLARLG